MDASEIITLRAPAIATAESARIPDLITLATEQTGPVYDVHIQLAIALLVLHWLALEARGAAGSPGPINSEREGDLARSYGSLGAGARGGDLAQTSWGVELQRLRDSVIFSARNRMVT